MKLKMIIFGLICFWGKISNGQDSNTVIFDEFLVSANRTVLQDGNTEDRFGFGLGIYHSFLPEKKLNIVLGLEYNRTGQFKKSMYDGHFANAANVTYSLNCVSIPFGLRANMGSKTKMFIEMGGFADLVVYSNRTGTMHTYLPDVNNQINYREFEIDENARLSNTIGAYFGVGVRIPISKYELVVKSDYKYGITKLYSDPEEILNRYFRISIGLKI
mgnify:CR=1 FL=1